MPQADTNGDDRTIAGGPDASQTPGHSPVTDVLVADQNNQRGQRADSASESSGSPLGSPPDVLSQVALMGRVIREAVSEGLRDALPRPEPKPLVSPATAKSLGSAHWSWGYTAGVVVFIGLMIASIVVVPARLIGETDLITAWVLAGVVFFAFGMGVGRGVTGTYKGLWMDQRYQISLSQFQLIAWSFLILSAYLVMVMWRVQKNSSDPLGVTLPADLWALLGISTGSFVGSSLIKQGKTAKDADPQELEQLKQDPTLSQQGQLVTRSDPTDASFADMFTGDEVGNALAMDASKLQMFFFTIVVLIGYALAIARLFTGSAPADSLPDVNASMVTLLLASHAGYLAYKAAPHSQRSGQT